jgi:nucleoside-diphosphate-sugar epimerase
MPSGVTLVTGASGFVGQALCRRLRALQWPFVTVGRRADSDFVADLATEFTLEPSGLAGVSDAVFCASAIPGAESPQDVFDRINVQGTRRLCTQLESAAALEHLVLLSSVAVYGSGVRTTAEPPTPSGPYGQSKLSQERVVRDWAAARAVTLTILRPSSIYGPGARPNTVLPIFVDRARRGESLDVTAPRKAVQNFVHVEDVVECIVASLRRRPDATLNVFADETLTYLELARRIAARLGVAARDLTTADDVDPRAYPNDRVRAVLGVDFRSFQEGLEGLVQ